MKSSSNDNTIKSTLDTLLSTHANGVFVVDTRGIITMANATAIKISGLDTDNVVGKKYQDVFNFRLEENKDATFPSIIEDAMNTKQAKNQSAHTVLLRKDLLLIPIEFFAHPVLEQDNVLGCVIIIRDVTRERMSDRIKTDFVSIASHELRTPLTAINGLISMIREGEYGPVDEKLKKPLDDVILSSVRLIQLVNNLLNDSRIEAGRQEFTISEFSLSNVINEIINFFQPMLHDKKVTLSAGDLVDNLVQADVDKVKQILTNLIGNALKFTDNGNIMLSSTLRGELAEIQVSDTGIGISPDDQMKLFGKFQQIDSNVGRPQGTGLGLHISRDIAQKMGGNVWLEKSILGQGSTFIFSVPLAKTEYAQKVKESLGSTTA